jgi:hypothetical protein
MLMAALCSDTPGRHSRSWTDGVCVDAAQDRRDDALGSLSLHQSSHAPGLATHADRDGFGSCGASAQRELRRRLGGKAS